LTKKVVALCTEDARYMKAFVSYVERHEPDRLFIKPFTDVDGLKEYFKNNKVAVVLIGEEFMEQFEEFSGGRLFVLSDERYVHAEGNFIFRYQSVDEVVKQLCGVYTDDELVSCAGKRNTDFSVVVSPCYPLERETFSRELADYYGSDNKVLYVNFAPFTASDTGGVQGLSEVLYYISEDSERLKEKIWEMASDRGNYKELAGVKNYRDLYAASKEEVSKLIECILDMDEYDKVVFDVGHIGVSVYPLFERCKQIIVPVMDEYNRGTARFMGDFFIDECEGYTEKVSLLQLPDWWNVGSEMRHRWISSSGY